MAKSFYYTHLHILIATWSLYSAFRDVYLPRITVVELRSLWELFIKTGPISSFSCSITKIQLNYKWWHWEIYSSWDVRKFHYNSPDNVTTSIRDPNSLLLDCFKTTRRLKSRHIPSFPQDSSDSCTLFPKNVPRELISILLLNPTLYF